MPKEGNPETAYHWLRSNSQVLRTIFEKITLLNKINELLPAFLGAHLAPFCQAADIKGHTLILFAANGAIATQIHFQANDLLDKFTADKTLSDFKALQCKVRHLEPLSSRTEPSLGMAPLTPTTAESIKIMAESLKDPALRKVMAQIASRTKLPPK